MNKKNAIIAIFVVGFLGILIYAINEYKRGPKEITVTSPSIYKDALAFQAEFKEGTTAFTKYADSVVELSGRASSINKEEKITITLDGVVRCELSSDTLATSLKEGSEIRIKGVFGGYDDLFEEVLLVRCIVLE